MYILRFVGALMIFFFFFFNDTATTEIYTLSLHDALPIFLARRPHRNSGHAPRRARSPVSSKATPRPSVRKHIRNHIEKGNRRERGHHRRRRGTHLPVLPAQPGVLRGQRAHRRVAAAAGTQPRAGDRPPARRRGAEAPPVRSSPHQDTRPTSGDAQRAWTQALVCSREQVHTCAA